MEVVVHLFGDGAEASDAAVIDDYTACARGDRFP